jgi:hypothetical protein
MQDDEMAHPAIGSNISQVQVCVVHILVASGTFDRLVN